MMFIKHYALNRCKCIKVAKSIFFFFFFFWGGGAWGRVGGGWGGQGGCELRSEAFVKIQKKNGGGGGVGSGGGGGGVSGWGGGVRVDVNEEVKLL